ncbi:MAG: DUF429 domain-containing protein [Dehalococcoidia bacterium]
MDISSRWYQAAGASLVAAAVTARYVAKWRRRRSLRRAGQGTREAGGSRHYIGLDLTDPTAARQRLCDVAVLSSDLTCTFSQWSYKEDGSGIIPNNAIGKAFILAIDGPQGLAADPEAYMRKSERLVNAPGRTPYAFPTDGRPFSGFITGSVKLFYNLVSSGSRFRLLGLDGVAPGEANLIEVFPGRAFRDVGGGNMSRKQSEEGRRARFELLKLLDIVFPDDELPTADQLDAAMAAWVACCFDRGHTRAAGEPPELDDAAGVVREGYIVCPEPPDDREGFPDDDGATGDEAAATL